MKALSITGGRKLAGEIKIHGAKNSVLPILAGCVLCRGPCVLTNCPQISDVDTALEILGHLGCRVWRQDDRIVVDAAELTRNDIPPALMEKMRSSVLFAGALLARTGGASFSLPGGCRLGQRPIDYHLQAFTRLGARVEQEESGVCRTEGSLTGACVTLPAPSVGATENAILAAAGAKGPSRIRNAAREPEIADLCRFLEKTGVHIEGIGTAEIVIEAAGAPGPAEHRILPDRIETATYLAAAAACGGWLRLREARLTELLAVKAVLERTGCHLWQLGDDVWIRAETPLRSPGIIRTGPYPGFPTDAQAPIMAALLRAEGPTLMVDGIFEDRFQHVPELRKLGAQIRRDGAQAVITPANSLKGAPMAARELRGGAALVVGALAAEGHSLITGVEYLQRGYEKLAETLTACGAQIKQVEYFRKMVYNTL